MGSRVLSTNFSGTKKIRAYSHCSKNSTGITLLLINLDKKLTAKVRVSIEDRSQNGTLILPHDGPSPKSKLSDTSRGSVTDGSIREEYHLTTKDRDLQSQATVLNGQVLNVSPLSIFPELRPVISSLSDPLTIAPYSVVFVRFPGINIAACK